MNALKSILVGLGVLALVGAYVLLLEFLWGRSGVAMGVFVVPMVLIVAFLIGQIVRGGRV